MIGKNKANDWNTYFTYRLPHACDLIRESDSPSRMTCIPCSCPSSLAKWHAPRWHTSSIATNAATTGSAVANTSVNHNERWFVHAPAQYVFSQASPRRDFASPDTNFVKALLAMLSALRLVAGSKHAPRAFGSATWQAGAPHIRFLESRW